MRSIILSSATLLAIGSHAALAQDTTRIVGTTACAAHLPPGVFSRVAVYAFVRVDSGASNTVRGEAENFLTDVAAGITRELHGAPGNLPRADSAVDWRRVDGSVKVTAFHDGRFTWQTGGTPRPDGATHLLSRALHSADSAGAAIPLVADADGVTPDSITFWIKTVHPDVDHAGRVTPMKFEGTALPVFSLPVPWFEPATLPPRSDGPHYPVDARDAGAQATVIELFVVDTVGLVDPSTIHEDWPAGVPPLEGDRGRYWREFVASVHSALATFHYAPAQLGGCPVREFVRQSFQFSLRARL
ncbi:MAG: hypothetical protein ACRENQ_01070 [Gemmatimonadaceae bacterium]